MTRGRFAHNTVSDEEVFEAVAAAYDNDERIAGGGVAAEAVAARLPIAESTTRDRLRGLLEDGRIENDWGFEADGPARGYAPAAENGGSDR